MNRLQKYIYVHQHRHNRNPRRKARERVAENVLEEVVAKSGPSLMKTIKMHSRRSMNLK